MQRREPCWPSARPAWHEVAALNRSCPLPTLTLAGAAFNAMQQEPCFSALQDMVLPLHKFLAGATAMMDSILAKLTLGDVDTANDIAPVLVEVCKVACPIMTHVSHACVLDTLPLWCCCSRSLCGNSAYMFNNALPLPLGRCVCGRICCKIQESSLWRQPASAAPTGMQGSVLHSGLYAINLRAYELVVEFGRP